MSKNITVSIPHQLTRAQVRERIDQHVGDAERQYGAMMGHVERNWAGDVLSFSVTQLGQKVSGTATVEDDMVFVEVELPAMLAWLAAPLKKQIEQRGKDAVGLLSGPATK